MLQMRIALGLLCLLVGSISTWAGEIQDVSPDGKYGLEVTKSDAALNGISLVSLPDKKALVHLVDTDVAPNTWEIVWSEDSRNFAFYRKIGAIGTTEPWSLNNKGDWQRLIMPPVELPFEADAVPASVTTVANYIQPLKWLGRNELEVSRTGTSNLGSGKMIEFDYKATLTSDADGRLSVSNLEKISQKTVSK